MTALASAPIESALADAERDVIATVLYLGQLPDVARDLALDDFGSPRLREAWGAILRLSDRGLATDPGSVAIELERRADQSTRVGRPDLVKLMGECSIPGALPTYVKHVREAAERRRWRENGTRLLQAADLGDLDAARAHAATAAQRLTRQPASRRDDLRAQLLTRPQLADLPQPEVLIGDTLDQGTVAILVGYTGTLKTFLALDWACCVQSGKPWQGRPVRQGAVLFVAAEGATGLHQRITAWEHAWRHDLPGITVLPRPVQLLEPAAVAELSDIIRAGRYRLVVLDTFARCFVGGEENSARDVGMAVDALYRLRDATDNGTVLAVHHTGKDRETTRGSSALESGVDTVYRTEGDAQHVNLTRTKRKDGPRDDTHNLRLDTDLDSGVVVSTSGLDMALELKASETRLMSIFMSTFSDTGASKSELRTVAAEHGMKSSGTFTRALNDLVRRGALTKTGSDARPRYTLPDTPPDQEPTP